MKKILMLSQTVFPPDIRLEKEIKTLHNSDYSVTVICNQFDKLKTPDYKYCKIERISALFNSYKINKLINFPVFFNPRYLAKAIRVCRNFKPDYIHAHDMPMVPLGVFLGRIFRIPVIYDMHENYPQALRYFDKKGLFNFLFKNYRVADFVDRFSIINSDRIIVVVDENKDRLIESGIAPDKISVVSNLVDLSTFGKKEPDSSILSKYSGRYIILYTGTVSPERGLETPLLGIEKIRKKIPEVLFLIIGDGLAVQGLREIIESKSLHDNAELIKWPGHENLSTYLELANLGVIPQPFNEYINTTIPHKLFEYMSQSKPLLVSDAKPLKRIVEETGAGLVFRSNDPDDFSEKFFQLIKSEEDFGGNGLRAVEEKYNWDIESKKLLKVYDSFS